MLTTATGPLRGVMTLAVTPLVKNRLNALGIRTDYKVCVVDCVLLSLCVRVLPVRGQCACCQPTGRELSVTNNAALRLPCTRALPLSFDVSPCVRCLHSQLPWLRRGNRDKRKSQQAAGTSATNDSTNNNDDGSAAEDKAEEAEQQDTSRRRQSSHGSQ